MLTTFFELENRIYFILLQNDGWFLIFFWCYWWSGLVKYSTYIWIFWKLLSISLWDFFAKLSSIGFCLNLIKFFASYLCCRKQFVWYNNFDSLLHLFSYFWCTAGLQFGFFTVYFIIKWSLLCSLLQKPFLCRLSKNILLQFENK